MMKGGPSGVESLNARFRIQAKDKSVLFGVHHFLQNADVGNFFHLRGKKNLKKRDESRLCQQLREKEDAPLPHPHPVTKKNDHKSPKIYLAKNGNVGLFQLELNAILASLGENVVANQDPLFRGGHRLVRLVQHGTIREVLMEKGLWRRGVRRGVRRRKRGR